VTAADRYRARVAARRCVQCDAGLLPTDGVRCLECAAAQCEDPGKRDRDARHNATPKRRAYRAAWMARGYVAAAEAKVCADCGAPSIRFRRCAPCRVRRAAYNADYRARQKEQAA
jgi:hypothetical protein